MSLSETRRLDWTKASLEFLPCLKRHGSRPVKRVSRVSLVTSRPKTVKQARHPASCVARIAVRRRHAPTVKMSYEQRGERDYGGTGGGGGGVGAGGGAYEGGFGRVRGKRRSPLRPFT
jgi:hypothetical protein